ncbi:MAG: hypothetical protein ACRDRJ_24065 [Streptosporangiaceae bacterium]
MTQPPGYAQEIGHLVEEHHAEPAVVARDAPTLGQVRAIHDAAHQYPDASWGQVVMQARADTWWAERNRQYRGRPEIAQEIARLRGEAEDRRAAEYEYEGFLERLSAAGIPGAQRELDDAMTRQALETGPREPEARKDPAEWEAFFREVLGRDMPLNAGYEAERYAIGAAAPPDVSGLLSEYLESHDPQGFDYGELAAERGGMSLQQLFARRYRELHPDPAPRAGAAGLAAVSFPYPVQPGAPGPGGQHAPRRAPQPGPAVNRRGL